VRRRICTTAGVQRLTAVGLAFLWLASPLVARQDAQSAAWAEPQVVQRFLSRADEPLTRYRALRRLEARNDRFKLQGWMEVWTELTANGRFSYTIVREGGSEYIRNKVLRALLANEEKLFATTDASRAALTTDNYELQGAEAAEPGFVRLLVKPKRREVSLVDGAAVVTEEDADLVRVEGRLAKNPSFWTKRVDVVRRYHRIGGVRVPTRLDTVAQVRLAGTSTLSMTFDYEMVNGVHVAAANTLAERP
jgi:hypothetical protein